MSLTFSAEARQPIGGTRDMSVIDEIASERTRQVAIEGWTFEHDDRHPPSELAQAAACYALVDSQVIMNDPFDDGAILLRDLVKNMWPWELEWWKPKSMRRNLVVAAALIVAEIVRLDRQDRKSKSL